LTLNYQNSMAEVIKQPSCTNSRAGKSNNNG
jgi:hypothetical protein